MPENSIKICGMMAVRNEEHELALSARVALRWCDSLVILLHACTDRSAEIAAEIAKEHDGRVWVFESPDSTWHEMQHRQAMLELARCADGPAATHMAIVDCDEVLTGNLLNVRAGESMIRGMVRSMPAGHILQIPLYNLRGGINQYHADGVWGNRIVSVAFADDARLGWSGDRFHAREPQGTPSPLRGWSPLGQGDGGVMHLWGANERRLIAKHAAYKCTEALRWPNKSRAEIDKMYSWAIKGEAGNPSYGTPATWKYKPVPDGWWAPYVDLMQHLHLDNVPWQEAEVQRLVAEHGRERFAGLDLFGVA